jgi:pyridoxamine 5'-phosphate oxidase
MERHEIMGMVDYILENAKVGILSTTTNDAIPHMRWMTFALLKERPGMIFSVTSPRFRKVFELETQQQVEWMFQTRDLNHIVNLRGKINIIEDNPSLKTEILRILGGRLNTFWKLTEKDMGFVVLETVIHQATYYRPMKGLKETVLYDAQDYEKVSSE